MGDQTHLESASKSILQGGDVVRGSIAGEHDLAATLLDSVEGVEELLLEALLSFHELDVIDEEYVVATMEVLELWELLVADGFYEPVHERLTGYVPDLFGRIVGQDVVADGLEEMGLS